MVWTALSGAGTLLTGIGALAAWKQSKAVHTEVRTNHGVRAGDRIENIGDQLDTLTGQTSLISRQMASLTDLVVNHLTDKDIHHKL